VECEERGKLGILTWLGVEREIKKAENNMGLIFSLSNGVEWFSNVLGLPWRFCDCFFLYLQAFLRYLQKKIYQLCL